MNDKLSSDEESSFEFKFEEC